MHLDTWGPGNDLVPSQGEDGIKKDLCNLTVAEAYTSKYVGKSHRVGLPLTIGKYLPPQEGTESQP